MEIFIVILFCFILPFSVLIKPIIEKIKNKQNIKEFFKNNKIEIVLFLILVIGSFVRLFKIGSMPNALNVDEASSGYDAFSLMKYGIDRNGNSFPVVLYSWGSGQSILYSLIMIPFLQFGGLTEFTMRVPMAIVGIISLYVMYYLLKNIFDNKKIALLGTFFLSICPWHIMKSRWGMECNLFPDLILFAIFLLIIGIKKKKTIYQVLAFIMFGISSYSYATSYLFLPFLVCGILAYLIFKKEISIKKAIIYLGIVFVIAIPLIIYLVINTFDLNQISILEITIPKLKVNRYEEVSTIFSGNIIENCVDNLLATIKLLIMQYDGLEWNALKNYGIIYFISLPFFIIGLIISFKKYNKNIYNKIIDIWMISAIILSAFCKININHINIMMIPIIYYSILGIYEIIEKYNLILPWIISIYILLFILFTYDYSKQDFNNYFTFNSGIQELSEYCEKLDVDNIYCDYSFKEPFIYFLFYQEYDVHEYLDTVEYFKKDGTFDNVKAFGKYKFYLPEKIEENSIIIVPKDSKIDYNVESKEKTTLNQFDVYMY